MGKTSYQFQIVLIPHGQDVGRTSRSGVAAHMSDKKPLNWAEQESRNHLAGTYSPPLITVSTSDSSRQKNTYILLTKRSLFTPFPLFPLGFSVHISLTFSSTMLQWRSNALTRARSLRLFRQEIKTWVCVRVAVCRSERGPAVISCSSTRATSYSLGCVSGGSFRRAYRSHAKRECDDRMNRMR